MYTSLENIFPGKTRKPWFMLLYLAELIIVIVYCMVCLTATYISCSGYKMRPRALYLKKANTAM